MMICLEQVSLTIQKNEILHQVTAQLERGMIHGIVGRNGSGKTMLMKCICGFIRPTAGTIVVAGQQVGRDVDFPPHMGLLIETPGFVPYYSGRKNLELLAAIQRGCTKEGMENALRAVGLDPDSKKRVGKYSLGMRQRLGIAQAIMEDPEMLILDEPFNGLDEQGVEDIRTLLLTLKEQGKTILLSSHNKEDIQILCDQVFHMERGRVTQVG